MIGCNMEGVAASSVKVILCDKISKLLSGHNKITQQVSNKHASSVLLDCFCCVGKSYARVEQMQRNLQER